MFAALGERDDMVDRWAHAVPTTEGRVDAFTAQVAEPTIPLEHHVRVDRLDDRGAQPSATLGAADPVGRTTAGAIEVRGVKLEVHASGGAERLGARAGGSAQPLEADATVAACESNERAGA